MAVTTFVVFTLLCHFAYADNCDCAAIDLLKDIIQSEIMERKLLTSKMGKLETEVKVGIANSAADKPFGEKQLVMEPLIEQIKNEIQSSKVSRQQIAQVKTALTNAWTVHKKQTLDLKKEIENHFQVLKMEVKEELININDKLHRVFEEINGKMREYNEDKTESLKGVHASIRDLQRNSAVFSDRMKDVTLQLGKRLTDLQRNTTVFSDSMKDVTLQLEKRLTDLQNKHEMYQNQADSSVRDLRGKTERVISELEKKDKPPVYKCHRWTPSDQGYIYWPYSILNEKIRCEIYPNQVFTHGVNDFVPGCEENCWCCRRVDD